MHIFDQQKIPLSICRTRNSGAENSMSYSLRMNNINTPARSHAMLSNQIEAIYRFTA